LLIALLARKHWVKRGPGAFRGVIRVAGGEVDSLRMQLIDWREDGFA